MLLCFQILFLLQTNCSSLCPSHFPSSHQHVRNKGVSPHSTYADLTFYSHRCNENKTVQRKHDMKAARAPIIDNRETITSKQWNIL